MANPTFIPATKSDFDEFWQYLLGEEGGYCDDLDDKGGPTCYGITQTTCDDYRSSHGLSKQSVHLISQEEAKTIYWENYWLKSHCQEMPRRVAIAVFDWQVNSYRGVTLLQACLGVEADGLFGHKSLNELTYHMSKPGGEDALLQKYFDAREATYRQWGIGSQKEFLDGWLDRCENLKKYLHIGERSS